MMRLRFHNVQIVGREWFLHSLSRERNTLVFRAEKLMSSSQETIGF